MRAASVLLCALLAACAPAPQKVALDEYIAPRVDCQQAATADVPSWPVLWWMDGPAFAIQVLGLLGEERMLRAKEQACIEKLKGKGIIR